jgi:predicted TIM-barrel fold metal-dependent hydrolase
LPAGACDSHFHVFGEEGLRPQVTDPSWDAPDASIHRALDVHASLGIERGVIVQPSVYGTDHRAILQALRVAGPGYRGCVTAKTLVTASDTELAALHEGGIRGGRFSRPGLVSSIAPKDQPRVLARLAELGWYAKLQPDPAGFAAMLEPFWSARLPLLVDHMGRPDLRRGPDDPNLLATQRLLRDADAWVLLTLADRISLAGFPWHDVVPLARSLIDIAPGRCLWGTDWPHLGHGGVPAADNDLSALLSEFAPEAHLRHRILVENPMHLFRFPTPACEGDPISADGGGLAPPT